MKKNPAKHLIIIRLMDAWWQLETNKRIKTLLVKPVPDIPTRLMMLCDVVYDVTTDVMIKNRHSSQPSINDAIKMRIWLSDLPTFKYTTSKNLSIDWVKWDNKKHKNDTRNSVY